MFLVGLASLLAVQRWFSARIDVRREGSLPSLALPSVWEGQVLAAMILPLPNEKIEFQSSFWQYSLN